MNEQREEEISEIGKRALEIAKDPDHHFWTEGKSAKETLKGYGMQRVARFKLTGDEQTMLVCWEVKDAKKWTEVVYAQVIGNRIVRIGASRDRFGKRFGNVDSGLNRFLRGKEPSKPWVAEAWKNALRAHGGVGQFYAHVPCKFETRTGKHSIYLGEETDLIKRHCPPFNGSKFR